MSHSSVTFQSLPPDVLRLIFLNIHNLNDLRQLRQVSKPFQGAIDSLFSNAKVAAELFLYLDSYRFPTTTKQLYQFLHFYVTNKYISSITQKNVKDTFDKICLSYVECLHNKPKFIPDFNNNQQLNALDVFNVVVELSPASAGRFIQIFKGLLLDGKYSKQQYQTATAEFDALTSPSDAQKENYLINHLLKFLCMGFTENLADIEIEIFEKALKTLCEKFPKFAHQYTKVIESLKVTLTASKPVKTSEDWNIIAGCSKTKYIFINLKGLNCEGVRLCGANFSNAYLPHARFNQADLSDSDFSQACLSFTNFAQANLRDVMFDRAHLYKAKFALPGNANSSALLDKTSFNCIDMHELNYGTVGNVIRIEFKLAKLNQCFWIPDNLEDDGFSIFLHEIYSKIKSYSDDSQKVLRESIALDLIRHIKPFDPARKLTLLDVAIHCYLFSPRHEPMRGLNGIMNLFFSNLRLHSDSANLLLRERDRIVIEELNTIRTPKKK